MICYVQLYLMVMIIQINGLVKKASANTLASETRDEILSMIQDWIQRNKVSPGERVYHLNMDTHGDGAKGAKGISNGDKHSVWSNKVKLKDEKVNSPYRSKRKWIKFKQPNRFPGFRYYGSFNRITPELLDPSLINHDNQLQWSDLIGNHNNLFDNGLVYLPSTEQPNGHHLLQDKVFDDYRTLLGQNHHLIRGHHEPHHPHKQDHKHDHNHNHNHNHEHKHHYHVTKTKTKHIHHVTVPIPYPVHIKVQRHHKHHHHGHKNNDKDIKPWLLIAAIGLPLLLGALLLPLALLFLTTLVTLFAALAGGGAGGLFGGFGGGTLIPITTTTATGKRRRSTEPKIYDSQSLDALCILIMEGIYSMASNLQNDHYQA